MTKIWWGRATSRTLLPAWAISGRGSRQDIVMTGVIVEVCSFPDERSHEMKLLPVSSYVSTSILPSMIMRSRPYIQRKDKILRSFPTSSAGLETDSHVVIFLHLPNLARLTFGTSWLTVKLAVGD